MTDAQQYLNQNYPDKTIKILNLEGKELEGHLDFSEFTNLEELNCSYNELIGLNLDQCTKLVKLDCSYNLLDNLDFLAKLPNPEKLIYLDTNDCGVFLSQEEMEKVLKPFVNLNSQEKLEEEKIMSLGEKEDLSKEVGQAERQIKEEELELIKEQVKNLKNKNQLLKNQLSKVKEQNQEYQDLLLIKDEQINQKVVQLKEKSDELEKIQQEFSYYVEKMETLSAQEEKLSKLEKEMSGVQNDLKQKENLLKEKDSNQEKLQKEISKLKIDLIEKEKQIGDLQIEKAKLIRQIILYRKITKSIEEKKEKLEVLKNNYLKGFSNYAGMSFSVFSKSGKRKEIEERLDTFLEATVELLKNPGSSSFVTKQKKNAEEFLRNKPGFFKLPELEEKQKELSRLEIQLEDLKNQEKELEIQLKQEKTSAIPTKEKNTDYKNILLIGKTGNGKSTLANTIIGNDKFKGGASSVSETKEIKTKKFEYGGTKYRIIDTPGLSDTQLTDKQFLEKVAQIAYSTRGGISQIFFVVGMRFDANEKANHELLEKTMFGENISKYITVVRTNFPEFEDNNKCEEDRNKLLNENPELARIVKSNKIIYVDNAFREKSRIILLEYLQKNCQKVYQPNNLEELNRRIGEHVEGLKKLQDNTCQKPELIEQQKDKLHQETIAHMKEKGINWEKWSNLTTQGGGLLISTASLVVTAACKIM